MSESPPISYRQRWREFLVSGALAPLKSHSALAVYLAYAAHANKDGLAWLSTKVIMTSLGLSEDSVSRGRAACVAAGFLIDLETYLHRCKLYRVSITPTTQVSAGGEGERLPASCGVTTPDSAGGTTRKPALDYPQNHGTKGVEGRREERRKGARSRGSLQNTSPEQSALAHVRRSTVPHYEDSK